MPLLKKLLRLFFRHCYCCCPEKKILLHAQQLIAHMFLHTFSFFMLFFNIYFNLFSYMSVYIKIIMKNPRNKKKITNGNVLSEREEKKTTNLNWRKKLKLRKSVDLVFNFILQFMTYTRFLSSVFKLHVCMYTLSKWFSFSFFLR